MAEVSRTIVNFGVLELSEEFRECLSLSIYCQIERKDLNASLNAKRQRPASFYGYAQGIENGYVIWEKPLTFENEEIFFWYNNESVLVTALDCQTKTILDTIDNLAVALGLAPLGPYNAEVRLVRAPTQRILFKLFGKTTLYVRAVSRPVPEPCSTDITWVDREAPAKDPGNPRIPSPPPPVPVNPSDPDGYDTPDPPYDGDDDGGESYKPPLPCVDCRIIYSFTSPGQPRYPGGPNAPLGETTMVYPAGQCPLVLNTVPPLPGASWPVEAQYEIRDRNGTLVWDPTSYVANPLIIRIENGGCT